MGYHDLDRTCAELDDGAAWRRLLEPLVQRDDGVIKLLLGDKRSALTDLPAAIALVRRLVEQGTPAWRMLSGVAARALFSGVAAHTISQMPSLVSSGAGLMLATLAHTVGWPIPVGGSQAIPDALIADLRTHGSVTADCEISEPPGGVVLFDTAPTALLSIYRDALPAWYAKALRRYRFGPGVAKVDFALSGEIPWSDPRLATAPTLHLGGTREQMARGARGRRRTARGLAHGARLLAASRRPWPHRRAGPSSAVELRACTVRSPVDQTAAVTAVFERFAPGFRDIVVAARSIPAARMTEHNANYVGGDIGVGGNNLWHALAGPTPRLSPWSTPIDGV